MAMLFDKTFEIKRGRGNSRQSNESRAQFRGQVGPDGFGEGWNIDQRYNYTLDPGNRYFLIITHNTDKEKMRRLGTGTLLHQLGTIASGPRMAGVLTTTRWPYEVSVGDNEPYSSYLPVPAFVSPSRIVLDLAKVAIEKFVDPDEDEPDEDEPEQVEPAPVSDIDPEVFATEQDMTDMEEFMAETCRLAQEGGWTLEIAGHNKLLACRTVRAGLEVRVVTNGFDKIDGD